LHPKTWGCPDYIGAEIIPIEPEADNTDAGKSEAAKGFSRVILLLGILLFI
jgi:hypothetical protein